MCTLRLCESSEGTSSLWQCDWFHPTEVTSGHRWFVRHKKRAELTKRFQHLRVCSYLSRKHIHALSCTDMYRKKTTFELRWLINKYKYRCLMILRSGTRLHMHVQAHKDRETQSLSASKASSCWFYFLKIFVFACAQNTPTHTHTCTHAQKHWKISVAWGEQMDLKAHITIPERCKYRSPCHCATYGKYPSNLIDQSFIG